MVRTVKSAIASASPKTLPQLDNFIDNFLLQYRNATHSTTKETPARLFKGRSLRASVMCVDSSDVHYFRGNDLRPSRGIITRRLGNSMVEITDLDDTTIHRRHTDQIQLKETPRPSLDEDRPIEATPDKDAETVSQPDVAPVSPTVSRRSTRKASQIDEAFFRVEGCDDRASSQSRAPARFSFLGLSRTGANIGQSRVVHRTACGLDSVTWAER